LSRSSTIAAGDLVLRWARSRPVWQVFHRAPKRWGNEAWGRRGGRI